MALEQLNEPYVIIAGTTKAGSTSLFHYLSAHPQVCASWEKEPRFFLDAEYPLFARYRLDGGGTLEDYASYFGQCSENKIRLEASPQYLYSMGAPERIQQSLPHVKLLFILRDPIARLVSYYRFAQQRGYLTPDFTFANYVALQFQDIAQGVEGEEWMRALAHGRYSRYLKAYFDVFRQDQMMIINFEVFKHDPSKIMTEICSFIEIDPNFYQDYTFEVFNQTTGSMKSLWIHRMYETCRRYLTQRLSYQQGLWQGLHRLHRYLRPIYLRLNQKVAQPMAFPDSLKAELATFYGDELEEMGQLFNGVNPASVETSK